MNSRLAAGLLGAFLLGNATLATATYSIVASDRTTLQTGGAGTSCLGGSDVYIIYGAIAGVGTVHAQATYHRAGRDRAVELLRAGQAPDAILQAITAASFDSQAASRQYAVVDVMGRVAGFTGGAARTFADDVQGQVGAFSYSVQGNILTGSAVLTQAADAFRAGGCDLADRLMLALEAGAHNAEGDSRCTESRGIPSDSAFLQVEQAGTTEGGFLSLRVPTSGSENPMLELREQFDIWRGAHPCGSAAGGAAGAAGAAGAGGVGGLRGGGGAGAGAARAGAAGAEAGAGRLGGTGGLSGGVSAGGVGGGLTAGAGARGGAEAGGFSGTVAASGAGGALVSGAAGWAGVGAAAGTRTASSGPGAASGCGCRISRRSRLDDVGGVSALALIGLLAARCSRCGGRRQPRC